MICPAEDLRSEEEEPRLENAVSSRNPCKLCTPLGACLAFRGVEGCLPFLHGSQGCATYIRRYLISHFREPMDIAASNFSENSAVFGGRRILETGLRNVARGYQPAVVGIATTCLSETIGEDMPNLLHQCRAAIPDLPALVHVSTASYRGSDIDGYHATVKALVEQLVESAAAHEGVNILPGMVSPADLRHLRELFAAFDLPATILPDYSDTLDGESWSEYERIPEGGTPLDAIRRMSGARATLEFGDMLAATDATAAAALERTHRVPRIGFGLPIGIEASDLLLDTLSTLAGRPIPEPLAKERGRLVDSLVDGHKVVFGKRAVIFGEADMVIGFTRFLCEIGVQPVLCSCGSKRGKFEAVLRKAVPTLPEDTRILDGADFATLSDHAEALSPDLLVGNSKGYKLARRLDIPLVRTGFPIHDRIGGQRVLHLGHRGAQHFYDAIVNTLLERKQDHSEMGFTYL